MTIAFGDPALRKALVLSLVLLVVDALVMNQGIISFFVGAWLVFISLPATLVRARWKGMRGARLGRIALGLLAVILVFALNYANNRLARSRADTLVTAIEAFQKAENKYPAKLADLVPKYVAEIPIAKYTLLFNQFSYHSSGDLASLSYIALPPFGRPTYNFKNKRWGYLD
jgi:hypothetical protein